MIKYNKAGLYFSSVNKEVRIWGREKINRAREEMTVTVMNISAELRSGGTWNCLGSLARTPGSPAANAAAQRMT
jgi:hypothetical protein